MKKWIAFLMAAVMVLAMAACGTAGTGNSAAPVNTSEQTTASGSDTSYSKPPASSTDTGTSAQPEASATAAPELDEEAFETAKQFVGKSVDELYAAIGQPEKADYAASCNVEGAQDGVLYYQGFYIYSIRTDESETVDDVQPF